MLLCLACLAIPRRNSVFEVKEMMEWDTKEMSPGEGESLITERGLRAMSAPPLGLVEEIKEPSPGEIS